MRSTTYRCFAVVCLFASVCFTVLGGCCNDSVVIGKDERSKQREAAANVTAAVFLLGAMALMICSFGVESPAVKPFLSQRNMLNPTSNSSAQQVAC